MQQLNEQLSEDTNEQVATVEDTAQAKTEYVAENSKTKETPFITEPQALVKIEGQEFEIEAALAGDDKLLKTILQPHFASVENANITRDVKEGRLTVTIVKKAQHKGRKKPKS
jgi:N-methylhydantoinase A/oxoprolinase/acetone carboxylase beta subunit